MLVQLQMKKEYASRNLPKGSSLLFMLNSLCAVVSLCLMFLPIAQGYLAGSYYSLFLILSMGGWFVTAFCINPLWLLKLLPTAALMGILVLFYALTIAFGFGNIRDVATTILPPYYAFFVAYFYYISNNKKALAMLGLLLFAVFTATMITTTVGLADNPYVYRESGGTLTSIPLLRQNIGLSHHIYSAVLVAALLGCFLTARVIARKSYRIMTWALFVFCIYVGLTCSSAIALLCAVVVLIYYPLQNKSLGIQIAVVVIAMIAFFLFSVPFAEWLQDLSGQIENEYISLKLNDIGRSLLGNSATGEVAARTDRWMIDFSAFLGSYGIGIGSYYIGGGNGEFVITDHSQLFADLGRYGIVFFVFMVVLFLSYTRLLKQMMRECGVQCKLTGFYLIFIIMYISQPIMSNYVIPMILFFFVPASIHIVAYLNQKQTHA